MCWLGIDDLNKDVAMGAGVHHDGSVSWHKVGVFQPKFDPQGLMTAITHTPSLREGKINPEDKIDKSWNVKFNYVGSKAAFVKGSLKSRIDELFPKGAFKNRSKTGNNEAFKGIVKVCETGLNAELATGGVSAAASETWMQAFCILWGGWCGCSCTCNIANPCARYSY